MAAQHQGLHEFPMATRRPASPRNIEKVGFDILLLMKLRESRFIGTEFAKSELALFAAQHRPGPSIAAGLALLRVALPVELDDVVRAVTNGAPRGTVRVDFAGTDAFGSWDSFAAAGVVGRHCRLLSATFDRSIASPLHASTYWGPARWESKASPAVIDGRQFRGLKFAIRNSLFEIRYLKFAI